MAPVTCIKYYIKLSLNNYKLGKQNALQSTLMRQAKLKEERNEWETSPIKQYLPPLAMIIPTTPGLEFFVDSYSKGRMTLYLRMQIQAACRQHQHQSCPKRYRRLCSKILNLICISPHGLHVAHCHPQASHHQLNRTGLHEKRILSVLWYYSIVVYSVCRLIIIETVSNARMQDISVSVGQCIGPCVLIIYALQTPYRLQAMIGRRSVVQLTLSAVISAWLQNENTCGNPEFFCTKNAGCSITYT